MPRSPRADDGRPEAHLEDELYRELRAIAGNIFRDQDAGHTLQPTALVHEAWLKLAAAGTPPDWRSRSHFCAVASKAMRQILIDHHRRRSAQKRGGEKAARVTLSGLAIGAETPEIDALALDEALERLAALDPRSARVVELRFYGGLGAEEIAGELGISRRTVEGEWRHARAWLSRALA
jgi:RNA polymerase sigma factor (TIGR02999 family)